MKLNVGIVDTGILGNRLLFLVCGLYVELSKKAKKRVVTVDAVVMRAEKCSRDQGQVGIRYLQHIVIIIPK